MFVPCCLSHFEVQSSPEPVSCEGTVSACCMQDCSAPSVVIMMHAPTIPGQLQGNCHGAAAVCRDCSTAAEDMLICGSA